ncbi:MAG: ATP-binding cassette domain-containing protein [Anaerolineae bacterium]
MSVLTQPIIEARGLHVRYAGSHALAGVDLSIAAGSFVVIGGRSGSGKSTLAHALLGLLNEQGHTAADVTGELCVAGLTPGRHSVAELATRAGLVFQNPATQLFSGTVEDEVAFGPRNLGLSPREIAGRVQYALEAAGCQALVRRSVRHLSGGEQQRVAVAASLAMRPSVIVLDEPTANLDAEGTRSVVRALRRLNRQLGITVVVIEHRLDPFLPHAERLIWMEDGQVADDGPPEEVLGRVKVHRLDSCPPFLPAGAPLITADSVTAGYDGRTVLRECSLTLREGEFAALVGSNGAGKSTLARVLAGVLHPRRGRVVWHSARKGPSRVGLLQQNPLHQLVCHTVEEEILFGPRNVEAEGDDQAEELLAGADLLTLRRRLTQSLSVGEQQRTALAATLSLRPRLLILDEPTIGQDWNHLSQVVGLVSRLNRQGQTVLLITHHRPLVDRCANRIWEVVEGRVREVEMQPRLA